MGLILIIDLYLEWLVDTLNEIYSLPYANLLSLTLIFILLALSYNIKQCGKLKLYYSENARNRFLLLRTNALNKKYRPTPYLFNGQLQMWYFVISSYYAKYKGKSQAKYFREIVNLLDGGCVSLDWNIHNIHPQAFGHEELPILVIIPGVCGGSYDIYIQQTILDATKYGFNCVVLNHRSCADTPLTTPTLYCAGSINDIREAILHIRKKYKENRIYGCGFSMGGNLIASYAGTWKEESMLSGVVTICNPFDFFQCDLNMSYLAHKMLAKNQANKVRSVKDSLRPWEKHLGYTIEEGLAKVRTNQDFDNLFTSKLFPYRTAFNYYRKSSCILSMSEIKCPTLILNYLDDPIIPKEVIPYDEVKSNPNIILGTHPNGGHLAAFTGWKPRQWMGKPLAEFLNSVQLWHTKQELDENTTVNSCY